MKSSRLILIRAALFFAVLAPQVRLAAQEHHHYKLIDYGAFGGPNSYVNVFVPQYPPVLNEQGTVAGFADTPLPDPFPNVCFWDCYVVHAFQAGSEGSEGSLTDLGSLPGGGSSAALWIASNGLAAGVSENGDLDPFGFPEMRAVLWQNGKITDLGTLEDPYQSLANAVNSSGQVVGAAYNTVPDSNSMGNNWLPGNPYQTRAFLWDKEHGMKDLGTLGTGTDAQALYVNDRGQIVGESYINSTPSPYCADNFGSALTTGAFIWENGQMTNLGSFGGTCTFATYLNNRGEVVGISTLPGDQVQYAFLWEHGSFHELHNTFGGDGFAAAVEVDEAGDVVGWATLPNQLNHAVLWRNGMMTDLGTLEGDQCSYGASVNARGQAVGQSATSCFDPYRVFLWENGSMVDLNKLIPPDSPIYLTTPETINDRGEIAGVGCTPASNCNFESFVNTHAFLLIPCDGNHPGIEGCDYNMVEVPAATAQTTPAAVRNASSRTLPRSLMRRVNRYRLPGPAFGPRN